MSLSNGLDPVVNVLPSPELFAWSDSVDLSYTFVYNDTLAKSPTNLVVLPQFWKCALGTPISVLAYPETELMLPVASEPK